MVKKAYCLINWEQVDATRTWVNEIVNKKVIDFLVLLIASDNNL